MEKIWLKSYPPGIPENINPDSYNSLVDVLKKMTDQYQDLPAFSNFGSILTYRDLYQQSCVLAAYLQNELGMQKGDRLGIMMPNVLQYPIAIFAAFLAGLIVVNINPLYTARELKHQLNDADVSVIIVLENFAHTVEKVLPETRLKGIIISHIGDCLGTVKGFLYNTTVRYFLKQIPSYTIQNSLSFKKIFQIGKSLVLKPVELNSEDTAFLQYTGGTTGVPKSAMLTHRNMIANLLQCGAWVRSSLNDIQHLAIGALPFYHIFALTVCGLCLPLLGVHCLLITNPKDISKFIKILQKNPPTIFVGINTLFNALIHHPLFTTINFKKMVLTISGGMATQKAVAEKWQSEVGVPIIEGYGLTEAGPVVTINPLNLSQFNGSIGLPVPSTDISIRNEQAEELPLGSIGELWVKGPQVMNGYWKQPEETAKTLKNDWLATGDMVNIDENGFLYLVDRKKDMILVSGFNVFPSELEEIISRHPGVKEVAVIGIEDEKSGEAPMAFIVRKDPNLSKQDIIQYCHQYLTGYKIPRYIEFRDELPKSNVGKVLRKELRVC